MSNGRARILRRGYCYSDGVDPATNQIDAGLIFLCFQRDPHRQFAVHDVLSKQLVHTSSAVFAIPPGPAAAPGGGADRLVGRRVEAGNEVRRRAGELMRQLLAEEELRLLEPGRATWKETDGTIELGWARGALPADETGLSLRAEADDEDALGQVGELIARHLKTHADEPVVVTWSHPGSAETHDHRRDRTRAFHARMRSSCPEATPVPVLAAGMRLHSARAARDLPATGAGDGKAGRNAEGEG